MNLDNLSISKKLLLVPAILIFFLIVVSISSSKMLDHLAIDMRKISFDLAPDTELAAEITNAVYSLRLTVKNYIQTGNDQFADRFSQQASGWNDQMVKAYDEISNPSRVKMLDALKAMKDQYVGTFSDAVVNNQRTRNDLVKGVLDKEGPQIEKKLTAVMQSAKNDGDIEAAFFAGQALRSLLLGRLYVSKFLVENQPEQVERFLDELDEARSALDTVLGSLENPQRIKLTTEAMELLSKYQRAAVDTSKVIYARNDGIKQLDTIGPQVATKVSELRASIAKSMKDAAIEAEETEKAGVRSLLIGTFIALVIAVLITLFITRAIVNKVNGINTQISDIAKGEGDLTLRIPESGKDELGDLGRNYNEFAGKLQQTIQHVNQSISGLISSAGEMTHKANTTQGEIRQQQAQAEMIASAMTEMSANAQQVSGNAQQASELSRQTNDEAANCSGTVVAATEAMQALSEQISQASEIVDAVRSDSEQIGTVLDVIKSIAEQTNLLALNAAIEAARAGDQGRGFSVVADEVRTLAFRTQESTQEIQAIITSLQQRSENASSAMVESRDTAGRTAEQVQSAESALSSIVDFISQIDSAVAQISTAASEQAAAVNEVTVNINSMSDIASNTLTQAEETTSSAEHLNQLGNEVNSMMSQFKV